MSKRKNLIQSYVIQMIRLTATLAKKIAFVGFNRVVIC